MESNKNDDVTCEMKSKPQSYVIFDTETTGLPGPYGNPKITELCLLGIHRDDMFEDGVAVPRIVNKMQLCLNPQKQVSPGSSMLTGLFNDALDRQQPFNSEIVEVIRGFLQTQAQPACLIAHNGDKFDFPLLAAQLRKVNQTLPDEILCADSLLAFREIDPTTDRPRSPIKFRSQTWEITEVTPAKRQNSDEPELHVPKKPKKDFDKTHSLFENIRRERAARQLYKDEANASVTEDETGLDKAGSLSENIHIGASSFSFHANSKSSFPTVPVCSMETKVQKDESVTLHNMCNRTGSEVGPSPMQLDTATTEPCISVAKPNNDSDTKTHLDSQGSLLDEDLLLAITQMEANTGLDHSSIKSDSVHPQASRLPTERQIRHGTSTVVAASDTEACPDQNSSESNIMCMGSGGSMYGSERNSCSSQATPLRSSGVKNPNIGSSGSSDTQEIIIEPMKSSHTLNSNIGPMSSSEKQKQSTDTSRSGTQSIDVKLTGSDPENTQALISSQEDANKDKNESQSILGGFQPSVNNEVTVIHDELPHKKASSELNSQGSLPDAEFLEAVQHMEKQDDKDFSVVYYRGQEVKVSDNDGKPSNTARDSNHNCSVVVHNQNGAASSNISSIKHVMPKSVQRKSYRLIDIYTRCFGHPPSVAHTAEDDCIALLKIVKKSTPQFLDWVDEHCVLFNTIPPMY